MTIALYRHGDTRRVHRDGETQQRCLFIIISDIVQLHILEQGHDDRTFSTSGERICLVFHHRSATYFHLFIVLSAAILGRVIG